MACYHPIPARTGPIGEQPQLWPPVATANCELPCGNCLGCKTDRALDWARRARHEATCWEQNCFITLTYSDERLPPNGQLQAPDLQKFFKRLRRCRDRNSPSLSSDLSGPIRYLASGEYGDQNQRPHYHALLFNCGFTDLYRVGKDLYQSHLANKLWPHGEHRIGTLTGASACYVAQYTVKKLGRVYATPDGEPLPPPFIRASLKPAIGQNWIDEQKEDLKAGYLIVDGHKTRVPRAYRQMLQKGSNSDRQLCDTLTSLAARAAKNAPKGRTRAELLRAAETIHAAKLRFRSQSL